MHRANKYLGLNQSLKKFKNFYSNIINKGFRNDRIGD